MRKKVPPVSAQQVLLYIDTGGAEKLPPPNQVAEITNACGKIGVANTVTCIGQKKFLEQWKLTILFFQIMQLLTPEAQMGIKIHKQNFQWTDD